MIEQFRREIDGLRSENCLARARFAKLRKVTEVILALREVEGMEFVERRRQGEAEVRAASIGGRVSATTAREKRQRDAAAEIRI